MALTSGASIRDTIADGLESGLRLTEAPSPGRRSAPLLHTIPGATEPPLFKLNVVQNISL